MNIEEHKLYRVLYVLYSKKIRPGTLSDIERSLETHDIAGGGNTLSLLIYLTKQSIITLFKGTSVDDDIFDGEKLVSGRKFATYYIDKKALEKYFIKKSAYKLSERILKNKMMNKRDNCEDDSWIDDWFKDWVD